MPSVCFLAPHVAEVDTMQWQSQVTIKFIEAHSLCKQIASQRLSRLGAVTHLWDLPLIERISHCSMGSITRVGVILIFSDASKKWLHPICDVTAWHGFSRDSGWGLLAIQCSSWWPWLCSKEMIMKMPKGYQRQVMHAYCAHNDKRNIISSIWSQNSIREGSSFHSVFYFFFSVPKTFGMTPSATPACHLALPSNSISSFGLGKSSTLKQKFQKWRRHDKECIEQNKRWVTSMVNYSTVSACIEFLPTAGQHAVPRDMEYSISVGSGQLRLDWSDFVP